jgi:hypothetical protein
VASQRQAKKGGKLDVACQQQWHLERRLGFVSEMLETASTNNAFSSGHQWPVFCTSDPIKNGMPHFSSGLYCLLHGQTAGDGFHQCPPLSVIIIGT